MSDLMKFFEEFVKQGFLGNHLVKNEHTLHLCKGNTIITGSSLTYVVKNLPLSCHFYVSDCIDTSIGDIASYICVYDN